MRRSPLDLTALHEHGYTTVGLFGRRRLRQLRQDWAELGVDPTENYYASSVHAERATARATDQRLKALTGRDLARVVPGHTTFLAAFIAKGAGGGDVELHPDWNYTDEREARSLVFWCPLVDTDTANGTMHLLPATHRRLRGLRGSGDFPSPVADLDADLLARHIVTVPLEAGEAVVWDAAMVHGSGPNPSDRPRPAAAFAMAPDGAGLVHFHREPDGPLEGYAIDESYYTTEPFGSRPRSTRALEPWADVVAPLTEADLAPDG